MVYSGHWAADSNDHKLSVSDCPETVQLEAGGRHGPGLAPDILPTFMNAATAAAAAAEQVKLPRGSRILSAELGVTYEPLRARHSPTFVGLRIPYQYLKLQRIRTARLKI